MLSAIIFIWWSPIKNCLLSARFMSAPVFDLIWAGRSSLSICTGMFKLYISRFVNGLSFFTGILLNIYFFKVTIIKKKTSLKAEFINRGASFGWSFGPHSAWGSIGSTTILTTHPSLRQIVKNDFGKTILTMKQLKWVRPGSALSIRTRSDH